MLIKKVKEGTMTWLLLEEAIETIRNQALILYWDL